MAVNMYREYRLKFYLNMRHYIIINEVKGETHPHTWEFALDINIFEQGISQFLEKYQNKILNEAEPFDAMMPTLENVTDYFAEEFFKIIYKTGGMLTRVEASETPTRSYIVNMAEQERNSILNKKADEKIISEVMDAVLDDIVKQ